MDDAIRDERKTTVCDLRCSQTVEYINCCFRN